MAFKRFLAFAYYSKAISDVAHTFEGDFDSIEAAQQSLDDIDYDVVETFDLEEGGWKKFKRASGDLDEASAWQDITESDDPVSAEVLDKYT